MSQFSENLQQKIKSFLTRYETPRSAILPVLHAIQDEHGWIKNEHIEALEKEYDLNRVHVNEVATFYSMYRLKEPAKFRILFCDNIVCRMMGAKPVMEKIQGHIDQLKRNGDAPFSLEGVPCLGVCDGAPAMLVNKDRFLKVNKDNVDQILSEYAPLSK